MRRPLSVIYLILQLFIATLADAETAPSVARLDYSDFVKRVALQHLEGAAQREGLAARRASLGGVGLLPDPTISLAREGVPNDDPKWTASLSQSFPWPGTLSAEDRAASAAFEKEAAGVELGRVGREFVARHTYLHLVEKAKVLAAATENLAQTEKLLAFSEAQFKHGIGSHTEFLQAVSDSRILRANVDSLQAELEDLIELAKAMIDLPSGLGVEFVFEFPKELTNPGSERDRRDVQAEALAAEFREIQADRDGARLRTMPNFSLSAMVMRDAEGMQSFGGAAAVSLPLFSGIKRGALADEKSLRAAASGDQARWYQKRKQLALSRARRAVRQNGENLRVLREEIIPFTTEHSRSALVAYQQGRGPLAAVVAGRTAVLSLAGAAISAEAALAIARCAEEAVSQGVLEAMDLVEIPPLPNASLGGGGGMSGMGGMAPLERSGRMRKPAESLKPATPQAPRTSPGDGGDTMPQGGMGM